MRDLKVAAMLAVLAALFFMSLVIAWKPPSSSADAASWAQAVTTAVALVVALFMPVAQHRMEVRREARRRAQEQADRLESAAQLSQALLTVCNKLIRHAKEHVPSDRDYLWHSVGELEALASAFAKFDSGQLSNRGELLHIVASHAAASGISFAVERALRGDDRTAINGGVQRACEMAVKSIGEHSSRLRDIARASAEKAATGK